MIYRLRVAGMVHHKLAKMPNSAGSAALVGIVWFAVFLAGVPRGMTPALAEGGTSPTPAGQPGACALSCPAQIQPGAEVDHPGGAPPAVCQTLAAAAAANELPINFLRRLIWQESRFDPNAVSPAGAQGMAQFMPSTATWRGVSDPFDAVEAITKSAQLLRDLRRQFGNLGLAAAAYNAGPGRVRDWLAGRRGLPGETRAYVRLVTGRTAEEWATPAGMSEVPSSDDVPEVRSNDDVPCQHTAGLLVEPGSGLSAPKSKKDPWGVELVGSSSPAKALAAYRQLQQKYSAILAGHEPKVVLYGVAPDMGSARVRVGAESRASAQKLCAQLRAAGAGCDVLRN